MHSEKVCGWLISARICATWASGAPGISIELNWMVFSHWPGWSDTALPEQAAHSTSVGARKASFFMGRLLFAWPGVATSLRLCPNRASEAIEVAERGARDHIACAMAITIRTS